MIKNINKDYLFIFNINDKNRLNLNKITKPQTLVLFKNLDEPLYVNIKNIIIDIIKNELRLNKFPLISD